MRVNLTLLFYNCTEDSDSSKATVFLKLAEMCAKENQLAIMDKNLENIPEVSASWALDKPQRLSLFQKCAELLIESGNEAAAF